MTDGHDQAVNDAEVPAFAWRVGERRAKQSIWLNEHMDAPEALRSGLVNWVVAADALDAKVDAVATRLLEVPREALALSKATFQFAADRQGQAEIDQFHFVMHQFTHQTQEAQELLNRRIAGNS